MSYVIMQFPQKPCTTPARNGGICGLDCGARQLCICFRTNKKRMFLYISFPALGGVRIRDSHAGFFEPEKLLEIRYEKGEDGALALWAGDTGCVLRTAEDSWRLEIYGADRRLRKIISSSQLQFCYDVDMKFRDVKLTLPLEEGEKVYGLGERFNGLCQNKTHITTWNLDCCDVSGLSPLSNDLGIKTQAYKNVPLLHSTRGYSLFFNTFAPVECDLGVRERDKLYFDIYACQFDLYVWTGTPQENLSSYLKLTGKPYLPPKWAFEYWAGGGWMVWNTPDESFAPERIREVLDHYEKMGIPIHQIYLEVNPVPEIFELLAERGVRALLWTNSCLPPQKETDFPYDEVRVKRASNPREALLNEYVDFTDPAFEDAFYEKYHDLTGKGLHGLMIDYADCMPEDALCHNGRTGTEMHNGYAYWYAKGMHEAFLKRMGEEFMLFQRSGCAGSQRYSASFGGDMPQNFLGLRRSVWAMLSAAASGFSIWGSDLGGYFPNREEGVDEEEVYIRWMQFASFSPLMRNHGWSAHEPWFYSDMTVELFQKYYAIRLSLLDKIYSTAVRGALEGDALVKSMAVAYGGSPEVDTQYLFCEDFLVCPITEQGKRTAVVTFPEDGWVDLYDGRTFAAGEHTVEAPLKRIPVFLRPGAVIPVAAGSDGLPTLDTEHAGKLLLVTEAVYRRAAKFYMDEEHFTEYEICPEADGFTVTSSGEPAPMLVAFYGTRVSEVKADVPVAEITWEEENHRTLCRLTGEWHILQVVK